MKSEILQALKSNISVVIKSELKNALAVDFGFLKSELQAVKTETMNSTQTPRSELNQVKYNVKDVRVVYPPGRRRLLY